MSTSSSHAASSHTSSLSSSHVHDEEFTLMSSNASQLAPRVGSTSSLLTIDVFFSAHKDAFKHFSDGIMDQVHQLPIKVSWSKLANQHLRAIVADYLNKRNDRFDDIFIFLKDLGDNTRAWIDDDSWRVQTTTNERVQVLVKMPTVAPVFSPRIANTTPRTPSSTPSSAPLSALSSSSTRSTTGTTSTSTSTANRSPAGSRQPTTEDKNNAKQLLARVKKIYPNVSFRLSHVVIKPEQLKFQCSDCPGKKGIVGSSQGRIRSLEFHCVRFHSATGKSATVSIQKYAERAEQLREDMTRAEGGGNRKKRSYTEMQEGEDDDGNGTETDQEVGTTDE